MAKLESTFKNMVLSLVIISMVAAGALAGVYLLTLKNIEAQKLAKQEAVVSYEVDEYDERFLRHLALGYTKEQITGLRGMPFGVKSLEKRQNELIKKLFPESVGNVNATRLVVRAIELHILDIDNLVADDE